MEHRTSRDEAQIGANEIGEMTQEFEAEPAVLRAVRSGETFRQRDLESVRVLLHTTCEFEVALEAGEEAHSAIGDGDLEARRSLAPRLSQRESGPRGAGVLNDVHAQLHHHVPSEPAQARSERWKSFAQQSVASASRRFRRGLGLDRLEPEGKTTRIGPHVRPNILDPEDAEEVQRTQVRDRFALTVDLEVSPQPTAGPMSATGGESHNPRWLDDTRFEPSERHVREVESAIPDPEPFAGSGRIQAAR